MSFLPSGLSPNGAPFEPGTRWAAYRSLISGYMDRLILRTPLFQVRLHRFLSDDREEHMHDHPFGFVSIILKGGYTEERQQHWKDSADGEPLFFPPSVSTFRAGQLLYRSSRDVHRLRDVRPGTVTLVLSSGFRKRWGFLVGSRIIQRRDYAAGVR